MLCLIAGAQAGYQMPGSLREPHCSGQIFPSEPSRYRHRLHSVLVLDNNPSQYESDQKSFPSLPAIWLLRLAGH